MPNPTTGIGFSSTTPAAPTGDQVCTPQSDGGTPLQKFDFVPKRATSSLYGTVLAQPASVAQGVIGLVIDGGGAPPATGLKGFIFLPYPCTITGWTLIADQAGSASVDVWFLAGSAPPTAPSIPTSANKISASAPPAFSSAQSAAGGSSAIATWTAALSQWGTVAFNLTAASTVTRIVLELQVTKS